MSGLFGGGSKSASTAPVAASAPRAAAEAAPVTQTTGRPVAAGGSTDLIRRLGFTGASGRGGATGSSMLGK